MCCIHCRYMYVHKCSPAHLKYWYHVNQTLYQYFSVFCAKQMFNQNDINLQIWNANVIHINY